MTPDSSLQKLLPNQRPATRLFMQRAHQAGHIEDETQPWPDLECATGYYMGANWQDQ